MRRRLFTVAAAVSAVLCVAVCVLWVRSYWKGDAYVLKRDPNQSGTSYALESQGGELQLTRISLPVRMPRYEPFVGRPVGFSAVHWTMRPEPDDRPRDTLLHQLRFRRAFWQLFPGFLRYPGRPGTETDDYVPYYAPAFASAILPGAWLAGRVRVRRWRQVAGLCPSCGYDLRFTPDRCPECGAVPKGAA